MILKKFTRRLTFVTFVFSFLLFVLLFAMYFISIDYSKWGYLFFQTKILTIPLILVLLGSAFICSLVMRLVLFFYQRRNFAALSQEVHLLAQGNFQEFINIQHIDMSENKYLATIEKDLGTIHKTLAAMTLQQQKLTAENQLTDQQKEEILMKERKRLARELHDSVSQQLFASTMIIASIMQQIEQGTNVEAIQPQLVLVRNTIAESQEEMRALLLHLRPTYLLGNTLQVGITQLFNELQTKIKTKLTSDLAEVEIPEYMEDQLFRIVQELLSNTLRHAEATHVELYLTYQQDLLVMRFIDDGKGFVVQESQLGSYGLTNIKERVAAIGGHMKIISFKNQGTSVEIKVPIVKEDEND